MRTSYLARVERNEVSCLPCPLTAVLLENGGGLAGRRPQQYSVKLKQLPQSGVEPATSLSLVFIYHPRFPFIPMTQHQHSWSARRRLPDAGPELARNYPGGSGHRSAPRRVLARSAGPCTETSA